MAAAPMPVPAPPRPLVVFDGQCGYCRWWVQRWRDRAAGRLDFAPSQEVAGQFPQVPPEQFAQAVHLILPDGRVFRAAEAVWRARAIAGRPIAWRLYRAVPGAAWLNERVYRHVAKHREGWFWWTRLLLGGDPAGPTYHLARSLFLRLLGLIFLVAIGSLSTQILGLVGSQGIAPIADLLTAAKDKLGSDAYLQLPTLLWFNASDAALVGLCTAGMVLAGLLVLGVCPPLVLALLWAVYLSLTVAGQDFLGFQWDGLLLETAFLAIFLFPFQIWLRADPQRPPARVTLVLLWFLLFRLMFFSGVVKLTSADPTWWNFTAMTFHYQTQPLPSWTSWHAHHLPVWFHHWETAGTLVLELALPLLIFAPCGLRRLAAVGLIGLQVLIAATGNFAFFNALTLVLCVLLLDDAVLRRALPRRWQARFAPPEPVPTACGLDPSRTPPLKAAPTPGRRRHPWWVRTAAGVFGVAMVTVGTAMSFTRVVRFDDIPAVLQPVLRELFPWRTINSYGLFATMTTWRDEIVVEGSHDGRNWVAYEFKYKPDDPGRAPAFVAPAQPRLDWQMWFAALQPPGAVPPWVGNFAVRLLEGSPPVLGLLATNPFPDQPPRFLRAVRYRYRFTTPQERAESGAWWSREPLRLYLPPISLKRNDDLELRLRF